MASDDRRFPSRERLDGEYPEHRDALARGEADDSGLGAMGEPLGGMGVAGLETRRAITADNLADDVPQEHAALPQCPGPAWGRRPMPNSGKRMSHAARGPAAVTLSELAACSTATEIAQLTGSRRRCHPSEA